MADDIQPTQAEQVATDAVSATDPSANQQADTVESIAEEISDSVSPVLEFLTDTTERLTQQMSSTDGLYQLGVLTLALVFAWLVFRPVRRGIEGIWPQEEDDRPMLESLLRSIRRVVLPLIWVAAFWVAIPVFRQLGIANDMLRIIASILQAWIVINMFSAAVRDPIWSRTFAALAWAVAVLYILRLLNPTIAILDSIGMNVGNGQLSIYAVIKGSVLLILLLWLANIFARFVQSRISRAHNLSSSVRSLISQAVRLGTLFIAVVMAMNAIGVDLTALAVFSGAVGVGIGFGLQAIFSNLMSGALMLMEGSVSVGDFVELESGVTGEVKEINTRATLITTNDRVDILVPNSQFINGLVTNWTLRDKHRRTRIPFGVAYGTDKELVKKAALEAASTLSHELTGRDARPAQVWLVAFGESSLDFELVLWLKPESVKRPGATTADYNWALETALGKYGIEIPFPQRDLHIRSGLLSSGQGQIS